VPAGSVLLERLGVGSVFEVALVRDEGGRELILKRVAPQVAQVTGKGALNRERDILRAASGVHLPELVDAGDDAAGPFLLQTKAPGTTLRAWLDGSTPRLDAARWLAMAQAASRALAALHALRDASGDLAIVHGDVSPDNLFFGEPSAVTFVDLSNATWRGGPWPVSPAARGTLPYAAPELARNEVPPTGESDTYALAATLLAVAVGPITRASTEAGRLFEVASSGVLRERIEERPDLPKHVRRAIFDALAFERIARVASSHELAERLNR